MIVWSTCSSRCTLHMVISSHVVTTRIRARLERHRGCIIRIISPPMISTSLVAGWLVPIQWQLVVVPGRHLLSAEVRNELQIPQHHLLRLSQYYSSRLELVVSFEVIYDSTRNKLATPCRSTSLILHALVILPVMWSVNVCVIESFEELINEVASSLSYSKVVPATLGVFTS